MAHVAEWKKEEVKELSWYCGFNEHSCKTAPRNEEIPQRKSCYQNV